MKGYIGIGYFKWKSSYIKSAITSIAISYIKVTTTKPNLNCIRFIITTIAISDIRVVVTWANNNISLNNYSVVNKSTRKARTNFIYNKELNISSI